MSLLLFRVCLWGLTLNTSPLFAYPAPKTMRAASRKAGFRNAVLCRAVCTDSGVHCYQGTKLLNTQWLKKRTPESFWGTVVSVSAFFKLLATVRSLVCGDRAHTNAPLSSTLNCLTQWKWSIMEFLPHLLVLLLLYNISIGSSQYTNRYVFSIWILSATFVYLLI